jgi:arylsulfatase A-like enzyme
MINRILILFMLWVVFVADLSAGMKVRGINVIYINADDLGYMDLGYTGSQFYESPNIDRLAKEGMIFNQAYAPAANCAPSRASCMSGKDVTRHGVYTVGSSSRGKAEHRKLIPIENADKGFLGSEHMTMAEVFKSKGYKTIHLGKWHLSDDPTSRGFDINIGGTKDGGPYRGGYLSPYQYPNCEAKEEGRFLTDHLGDEAVSFIEKHTEQPFFMYFSTYAVHGPIQGKPELVEKFKNKQGNDAQNGPEMAALIQSLDENIGRLVEAIKRLGISERTMVLFSSDNGGVYSYSRQWPLRAGKGSYYEGGIRVPLWVWWPSKVSPGESEVPVSGIDFFPTFLEAAQLQRPEGLQLDGLSLMPILSGKGGLIDRALYWHFPIYLQRGNEQTRDPWFRTRPGSAMRYGKWKVQEYFEDGHVELYNLEEDPSETKNCAKRYPEILAIMQKKLNAWRDDRKAPIPRELNPKYNPDHLKIHP